MALTLQGAGSSTTSTASPSIASVSIGAANAHRWVIVVIGSAANATISGVTIGGVAASIAVQVATSSSFNNCAAVAVANVPSGTTATVAWTLSGSTNRHEVQAYTIVGNLTAMPFASGSAVVNASAANVNVPAGGFAVGGMFTDVNSTTYTWTGLTKDEDVNHNSIGFTAASGSFGSAQTPLAVSCTPSGGSAGAFVVASFSPPTGGLFRTPPMDGVGTGGPFFRDPLSGRGRDRADARLAA